MCACMVPPPPPPRPRPLSVKGWVGVSENCVGASRSTQPSVGKKSVRFGHCSITFPVFPEHPLGNNPPELKFNSLRSQRAGGRSAGTGAGTRDPGELLFGWRRTNSWQGSPAGTGWRPDRGARGNGGDRCPRRPAGRRRRPRFPCAAPGMRFLEVSSRPIGLFLPPAAVTRSRSAAHVTIIFRELSEPGGAQGHVKSPVFSLPWGKGTEGGETRSELGLQRVRAPGRGAAREDAPRSPPALLLARSLLPSAEKVLMSTTTTCGSPGRGVGACGGVGSSSQLPAPIETDLGGGKGGGEGAAGGGLGAPSPRGYSLSLYQAFPGQLRTR